MRARIDPDEAIGKPPLHAVPEMTKPATDGGPWGFGWRDVAGASVPAFQRGSVAGFGEAPLPATCGRHFSGSRSHRMRIPPQAVVGKVATAAGGGVDAVDFPAQASCVDRGSPPDYDTPSQVGAADAPTERQRLLLTVYAREFWYASAQAMARIEGYPFTRRGASQLIELFVKRSERPVRKHRSPRAVWQSRAQSGWQPQWRPEASARRRSRKAVKG